MEKYDVVDIEDEELLLIVANTFGNGEPPHNGQVSALGPIPWYHICLVEK